MHSFRAHVGYVGVSGMGTAQAPWLIKLIN
jgi:hypothetical protein